MKICPRCQTRYQDDTLSFCLDDGTPLAAGPQSDTPTVVLGETETFVTPSGYGAAQPSEVTRVQSFEHQQPKSGSNTALVVTVTVLLMLLLFAAIGVGALLYMNSRGPAVANANTNTNIAIPPTNLNTNLSASSPVTNSNLAASPMPTVSMPSANTNTVTAERPPVVPDDGPAKSEISQLVYSWKSSLESRDLEGYMDNYASTLDYYTRSGMSRSAVRADKARAFNNYNSMRVNISNMNVTSDGPGLATATFDKEWTFSGGGSSSGKVRSQLKFREIGGKWLIVSERDVRVYYTR